MSLFKPLRHLAAASLALGLATALGACSFTPVYSGTAANQPLLELAYAKPATRLEQIVYQELALRFGRSENETAPLAQVRVSSSAPAIGYSATANPNKPYRATVTATLTLTRRDGTTAEPLVLTRQASAEYTTSGQVLADTAARTDADERAAKAAAESLRLALLAALSR
ncbi:LPS assembly lipoprotein LptE [Devosia ginsengisoli]|uniref:LPS assembly lipoprotein LptE n=1 Tax=Devosia ginsengisoli TaxID=400770 RepID=UPI0026EECA6E|nr:LPS assembly lipoprotein LptE [Devosia ginsengisoli]MCR6671116.1 hypothetical protein [Devosia ginsengisoli]